MNTILKIFDSIGFKFKVKDNKFIYHKNIDAFKVFDQSHVGYNVPYLARNIKANQWEAGVGYVEHDVDGNIVINRIKVVNSSNNNKLVSFDNSDNNEFYLFANQNNFDTGFSNTIIVDKSIHAYNFQAIYLADSTNQTIDIILPKEPLDNLVIEVKLVAGSNNVNIREFDGHILCVLNNSFTYNKFVYKNQWHSLYQESNTPSILSYNEPTFAAMANPGGDPYSFQFNDGSNGLDGASFYVGSGYNNLLLGSDSQSLAHTIIPLSGSDSTIFNNDKQAADFIVHGSGTKNLFFTYDGRLGLNIPSGSRPTTIFHVINTICQEGFRLENRNVCHPANMTLYHKPNGNLSNNTQISQINLAAKNSDGNKTNYAQINAYAQDTSSSSTKGNLNLTVISGNNDLTIFNANPNSTIVGYSGINSLTINNNSTIALGYSGSSIGITSSSVSASSNAFSVSSTSASILANSIVLGSGGSAITAQGTANIGNVQSSNITMPSVAPSSLLSTNESNKIVAASGISVNSIGTISFSSIPSGKFITTTTNGAVTGLYNLDDYFYTDSDIIWNKYVKRSATICLRQITLDENVPLAEFDIGDQIAIEASVGTTEYAFITELGINANNIVSMILDRSITNNTTSNFKIYSITKGGYLSISRYVEPGTVGDNSDIILSIRPQTSTVFNSEQKNIDFVIYGSEQQPALYVKAHTDQSISESGYYSVFATRDNNIFPMIVTTGGVGLSNAYSSANFGLDIVDNLFSGLLSSVGTNGKTSYYGTYDQNGNVAEWVEKTNLNEMLDEQEFVAGGSINTLADDDIAPTGLRSLELLDRSGCYDYVGFRIASMYNITDNVNISSATGLNMKFVPVTDPGNIADSGPLYILADNSYSLISFNNLGVEDMFYRIGTYEITNSQYIKFLQAVAKVDDRKLYDSRMGTDETGGIQQIVLGPADYDYSLKANMADKPVNFVSFISAIRYINWMHNGADLYIDELYVDQTIDSGAYNVVPNGIDTYVVEKQRYRKYWLPNLNQWHKAAYFEPKESSPASGVSAVMVRRTDPYLVSETPSTLTLASLSVSGWLYVDHLIVGDNVGASSPLPKPDFNLEPKTCVTNLDCGFCSVCVDGNCQSSTDISCVNDCCSTWDPESGTCLVTTNCFDTGPEGLPPWEVGGGG